MGILDKIKLSSVQTPSQAKLLIILLFTAAFGPYIFPQAGLRLEHFFIYAVFFYVILKMNLSSRPFYFNYFVFTLLMFCCLTLTWIAIISVFRGGFTKIYGALAGMENFLQPIALITICSWYFSKLSQADLISLFSTACITVIVLLSLNTLIAASSVFYDTWSFLQYFVVGESNGGEINTVSQLAATMGRFSGIFNQPFESGLAYSIGILCWVYLANTQKKISLSGWMTIVMLLIGGALSVSKVFIVLGLPLSVIYYSWLNTGPVRFRKSTITGFSIMTIGFLAVVVTFIDNWIGWSFFVRLFDFTTKSDEGFIATYTAGRISSDGSGVMKLFAETWTKSPVFGFGVPVEEILDNAYVEFFYLGGSVALAFYIVMLLVIVYVSLTRSKNHTQCGKFLLLLWVLTIIAGIGAPVFTINRTSIFFWILLILCVLIVTRKDPVPPQRPTQ